MSLSTRQVFSTVAMTLGVQALTSFGMSVPAVLAPVAALDLGVSPASVGVLASLAYVLAVAAGLVGGTLILRYGPIRISQVAIGFVVLGLCVGALGHVPAAFMGIVLIGVAHGFVNPASSQILSLAAPPSVRSLVFSIKQSGVPAGLAISGALLPWMLLQMSWPQALLWLGACISLALLLIQPFRATFDRQLNPAQPLGIGHFGAPLLEVWRDRGLRELAFVSMVYAAVQLCVLTYLISYFKIELGYTLVAAGGVFATASMVSVVARPCWGMLSDWTRRPRHVLAALGLSMGVIGFALVAIEPDWPLPVVLVVCSMYAGTAMSWQGVLLAEVARLAPPGRAGTVTGGTQVFTFSGAMLGPPIFGAVYALTGSYAKGFIFFAILPIIIGARLLMIRFQSEQ